MSDIVGLAVVSLADLRAFLDDNELVTNAGQIAYGRFRAAVEVTGDA